MIKVLGVFTLISRANINRNPVHRQEGTAHGPNVDFMLTSFHEVG